MIFLQLYYEAGPFHWRKRWFSHFRVRAFLVTFLWCRYRRTFIALDADDNAERNPRKILPRTYSISSQTSGFLSQLNLEQQQQQQPVERRDEELATFKVKNNRMTHA